MIIWLIRLGFIVVSGLFGFALADSFGGVAGASVTAVLVVSEILSNK